MSEIILNNNLSKIWDEYNAVRLTGNKKTANKTLDEFISQLKKEDKKNIKEFSDSICKIVLSGVKIIMEEIGEEGDYNTLFFLKKSYELSPEQETLGLILSSFSSIICFFTHELPIGVLAEPDDFNETIKKFRSYYE